MATGGALEGVFGRYALQFFGDTTGLKTDLDKLEIQATKAATHVEKSFASGFTAGVSTARESVGSLAGFVGTQLGKVAAFVANPLVAITALAAAFATFAVSAVRDAIEFDRAFESVRLQLVGTGEDIDRLKQQILDLTPSMASSAEEAKNLGNALAAGFSSQDAVTVLDTAAKLSRITGVDLTSATRLLTDTLRAYGLEARDAGRVSNVLLSMFQAAGGGEGAQEFIGALGRITPLANELKIPLEQVAAALITMRQQGVATGRGAQALGAILAKTASEAQKFRDAGINIGQVAETEGIPGILNAIKRVSGGTIEDMRGLGIEARTLNAILALSGDNATRFAENLAKVGGLSLDKLVKETSSLDKAMIDLKDTWEDIKKGYGLPAVRLLTVVLAPAAGVARELSGEKSRLEEAGAFEDPWEAAAKRVADKRAALAGQEAREGVAGKADFSGAARIKETEAVAEAAQESNAQRARNRENIALASQATQTRLKLAEDGAVQEITLAKQVAEARKASEAELLDYDRQALDTRRRFDEMRRQSRLEAIEAELPLLNRANAEEKKQALQLQEEKTRLLQEGLNARAKHEADVQVLAEKSHQAQLKLDDALFAARKTKGDVSLQEEIERQRQIAADTRGRSMTERIQAEAEAFKLAKEYTDQLFAHQKAMGLKSLQDEIDRLKQKAAAAKAGSAERMKAEEDVFKKEEELRNKRNQGAISILEKVKERLEARGESTEYITAADVQREIARMQEEQGRAALGAQRWSQGGGGSLEEVIAGYRAAGELNQAQAQQRELGGVGQILAGGAQVGAGPMGEALQWMQRGQRSHTEAWDRWAKEGGPVAGFESGYVDGMDKAYTAVDAGLTKIEERVNQSSSRTAQTIYSNIEEHLVRRIMGQLDRN